MAMEGVREIERRRGETVFEKQMKRRVHSCHAHHFLFQCFLIAKTILQDTRAPPAQPI
jgi:hypothetical protein